MNFSQSSSKHTREISLLVDKLSKETGVEKSIVYYFLINDLERIFKEKIQIHLAKLNCLETEFNELNHADQLLIQKITRKENEISIIQQKTTELKQKIQQNENQLSSLQVELADLTKKFNEINKILTSANNEKKQIEYDVMMKNHSLNEKTNFSFKKLGLALSIFTIIAIIIALILILKK